ncbi:MAG: aminotransferase class I/II-fold pyridoxal phosphate-dependent enzyme [Marinilabiliales bacterium]|nr:aminotransferase class I/II-fold pyridoxal phosphate-dependent enzyme [Marinilabiliales bacterium]
MDSEIFQPLQAAAAKALSAPDDWYAQLNGTYRRRRNIAAEIMNALSCTFDPAQWGLFLWGRIPPDCSDSVALTEELLRKRTMYSLPPGQFSATTGRRFIRISLCATEELLEKALKRITSDNAFRSQLKSKQLCLQISVS